MVLKIYGTAASQPTRAVEWVCKLRGLEYINIETSVTGSKKSKSEYRKLNPMARIPTIDDDGFILFESCAILTYLAIKHKWNDWYPMDKSNAKRKALIDEYLYWHHENTRNCTIGWIATLFRFDVKNWNIDFLRTKRKLALYSLGVIDKRWLSKHKYIIDNKLSLADFICYEELIQIEIYNFINFKKRFPNIYRWLCDMKKLKYHSTIHNVLYIMKPFVENRLKATKHIQNDPRLAKL